ncbi:MAG: phospholipase D-like domain-containing protein [Nitrososphaerota archaeon]
MLRVEVVDMSSGGLARNLSIKTVIMAIIVMCIVGFILGIFISSVRVKTTTLTEYRTITIPEVTGRVETTQMVITVTIRETSTVTVSREEIDKTISLVCFSKTDRCDTKIVDILSSAKRYVYVAVYSFTSDLLAGSLIELKNRGIRIRVVVEEQQVDVKGSEYEKLRRAGVDIKVDGNPDLMHHKFAVIDDEIVITGSYNWSASAEDKNDENVLVIRDKGVAELYRNEFDRIWTEAA